MRQLRQRIRVEYELEHLTRKETEAYILHRLDVAGRPEPLFKKAAFDRIYEYSRGVPRLVNHIASKALLNGFVDNAKMIDVSHVEPFAGESHVSAADEAPAPVIDEAQARPEAPAKVAPAKVAPAPREYAHRSSGPRRSSGRAWRLVAAILVLALMAGAYIYREQWMPLLGRSRAATVATSAADEARSGPVAAGPGGDLAGTPAAAATPVERNEAAATEAGMPDVVEPATPAAADRTPPARVPESEAALPREAPVPAEVFAGHIASFHEAERAERLVAAMKGRGLKAFDQPAEVGDRGTWFRVFVGPYMRRGEADSSCAALKTAGIIDYYLVRTLPRTVAN